MTLVDGTTDGALRTAHYGWHTMDAALWTARAYQATMHPCRICRQRIHAGALTRRTRRRSWRRGSGGGGRYRRRGPPWACRTWTPPSPASSVSFGPRLGPSQPRIPGLAPCTTPLPRRARFSFPTALDTGSRFLQHSIPRSSPSFIPPTLPSILPLSLKFILSSSAVPLCTSYPRLRRPQAMMAGRLGQGPKGTHSQ